MALILNAKYAEHKGGYKIFLTLNTGDSVLTDLEDAIKKDSRKIFIPLRDSEYFITFKVRLNTIT